MVRFSFEQLFHIFDGTFKKVLIKKAKKQENNWSIQSLSLFVCNTFLYWKIKIFFLKLPFILDVS